MVEHVDVVQFVGNPFCPRERVAHFCVCYHNKSDSTPGTIPAKVLFLFQINQKKTHQLDFFQTRLIKEYFLFYNL